MLRTQENCPARVITGLDDDALLLRSFSGHESVSATFEYHLTMVSENRSIPFTDVVGKPLTLELQMPSGGMRYFDGIVSRFGQTDDHGRLAQYEAIVVPRLWFLSRTSDCRIFQEKTVVEIVQLVLGDTDAGSYRLDLAESYPPMDYCVQYRETDLNFISRLLEDAGIYYYFEHHVDGHQLVLTDSPTFHNTRPGYEELRYVGPDDAEGDFERVTSFRTETEVQSGVYSHTDFDYMNPRMSLETRARAREGRAEPIGTLEVFDYPGKYTSIASGEEVAIRRMEELHARLEVRFGQSNAWGLAAGTIFTLTEAPREEDSIEYLTVAVEHSLTGVELDSLGPTEAPKEFVYACGFKACDARQTYRPPRVTSRPVVQGPQTAIVTGPSDEEIWTDELGRVKVHFPWDRHGSADEHASCWIRVAQPSAGKGWGMLNLPRIGHEVVVEFLDGDPDRPLVTGCVYNAVQRPPVALPDQQDISGVKTNTLDEAGKCNAILFSDKDGDEKMWFRAARDRLDRVGNDHVMTVEHDQHVVVENTRYDKVEKDQHRVVGGEAFDRIERARHTKVGEDAYEEVGGAMHLTAGDVTHSLGSLTQEVSGAVKITANQITLDATSMMVIKCGGSKIMLTPGAIIVSSSLIKTTCGTMLNKAGSVKVSAGMIGLTSALTKASGTVKAQTVIAPAVTASAVTASAISAGAVTAGTVAAATYTPGAGNVM